MKMLGRRYHIWDTEGSKTTKEHVKKLSSKIDRLEALVSELANKCGYVIAIEDFDTEYCTLVQVGSKTNQLEKE